MRLFVWTGGALFVFALARTAWLYSFELGVRRPYAGTLPVAVDVLLFTAFAAHHSLFARDGVKRALEGTIPERLIRSLYVWIASVLLIAVGQAWRFAGGELYAAPAPLAALFVLVQVAGLALTAAGVRAIDPLELAGIRTGTSGNDLQVRGAYRLVRHPLYLGWMLMVFGTPHMTGDRLTFAIATSAYLLVAIPWEERSLERTFGTAYGKYKQSVRWRVLPYVY